MNKKTCATLTVVLIGTIAIVMPAPGIADSLARQIEACERRADDDEHSQNQTAALKEIERALDLAKSLPPFDEKVSELRARQAKFLLSVKSFNQFAPVASKLIADAKPIEANMKEDNAIVELNILHESLLEYAIKNDSKSAFNLDLDLCKSFKKCNFNPCNVIILFGQFYIRRNEYAPLLSLGKQFNELRKTPSEFGDYMIYLSYDKQGMKTEANAFRLAHLSVPHSGWPDYRFELIVAQAMKDALQFVEATKQVDKPIAYLKKLLEGGPDKRNKAEFCRVLGECYELKCAIAAKQKNYQELLASSKAGQKYLDQAQAIFPTIGPDPSGTLKSVKERYKQLQAYEEDALRAQGKSAEANQLRAERFKRRFGMEVE